MYTNETTRYDGVRFMRTEKGRGKEEWIGWKIIEAEKLTLWMVDDGDNVERNAQEKVDKHSVASGLWAGECDGCPYLCWW